jgi:pre-mRNA-splicing helicase BRR2
MHAPLFGAVRPSNQVLPVRPSTTSSSCSPLDDEFFLFAPQIKDKTFRPNLTCTTNSRPRDTHETTGEPESLWGKIDPKSFGDRAFRGKPPELDEKLQKANRKNKERDPLAEPQPSHQIKQCHLQEESVLTSSKEGVYQPKTKEARAVYEAMLSVIQKQLGG